MGLGVVVLIVAVLLLATWLVLRRPDIPFEKLEAKYAVPTSHSRKKSWAMSRKSR